MDGVLKHHGVVAQLREAIVSVRFQPNQPLPSREALYELFHTTPVTLHRAVHVLVNHGYLRTEPRRGTFVVLHPPHVAHYAVVSPFPARNEKGRYLHFYDALRATAAQLSTPARRFSGFHEIDSHTDTEDYQRLASLVRNRQLAGLIFARNPRLYPESLEGTPLLETPDLPRVAIMEPSRRAGFPTLGFDPDAFITRAVEYLRARGRTRIAFTVQPLEPAENDNSVLLARARALGVRTLPHWIQWGGIGAMRSLRYSLAAVFHRGQNERPDALVITDDNMVPHATRGLVLAGVRGPDEVEIVAQTHFPAPQPAELPVTRLGYDLRQLVQLAVTRLEQQRRGETPPAHTTLPPQFEDELSVKQKERVV